jgi:TolA-binding protein
MEDEGMTFVFRADETGTYSLKFNRQDFLRAMILNDHVRVLVEDPPRTTGTAWSRSGALPDRVYAGPRWPPANPDLSRDDRPPSEAAAPPPAAPQDEVSPAVAASAAAAAPAAVTDSTAVPAVVVPSAAESAAVEDWLRKAREEYDAGRIAGALSALDEFQNRYPGGSDEAYWLYGRSLEANNEATRNIRLALEYYRRLIREYPQSSRYDDARQRIAYLERFYFTIQ